MHALEINQLSKTYANGVQAVKDLELTVKTGDFFALLGANGAGKSTTIGLISSLITKSSGHIKIHGFDLDKQTTSAKSSLGIVPQELNLGVFETCEQILINQAGFYGIARKEASRRASELLTRLGLTEKKTGHCASFIGGNEATSNDRTSPNSSTQTAYS